MFSLRSFSLELKLALLITSVIIVVVAASLSLTYGILTRSSELQVSDRLVSASRQLARTAVEATVDRAVRLQALAESDAIIGAFAVPAAPGAARDSLLLHARMVLASLRRSTTDSSPPVELWDVNSRRLTFVGRDLPVDVAHAGGASPGAHPVRRPGLGAASSASQASDSVVFGSFYAEGEQVMYWCATAVRRDGLLVGFLAQQLRFASPPQAAQSLRELTGEDVTMLMRNAGGDLWAAAPGIRTQARTPGAAIGRARLFSSPQGDVIAAEAALPGLPWVAFLETPLSAVHERTSRLLLTLASLGFILTVAGAGGSLLIGRHVARPLDSITKAAEAIARGDYARRVPHGGGDEIGRLAANFNVMAAEVDLARRELERRFEEARASAVQLEHSNEQLLTAKTAAERLREEAQHANRAKSDFLAVMSHELRTPLNAIGGYAQLIDLGVHGPVTDAQRDALARIVRSQAHLLRLINDVLNFARVDSGHVRYAMNDVPLGDTLAGLEALIAPQLRAKSLSFSYRQCHATNTVYADSDKLQQIVLNLLTNAIKFTPDGGAVAIECECDSDTVRIRVRDSGVGIPAERLTVIFDPFVQLDRTAHQSTEGVGLGLAISRDLAQGMSGKLEVESTVGEGSTFTLTLPSHAGARPTQMMAL